tara:strand:- start:4151 stop:4360 length:210 start_codon:yes stop_codon:yes gene_type:complete
MEKLPVRERSKVEKVLMKIGGPLAIVVFLLIMFVDISFLEIININSLSKSELANYENIGLSDFTQYRTK